MESVFKLIKAFAPDPKIIEINKRAFDGLLAYEMCCQLVERKYPKHLQHRVRYPKWMKLNYFAILFDVSEKEMKSHWRDVEKYLSA